MAERSFFIRGFQFPLCARCTGLLAGYIGAVFLYNCAVKPYWVYGILILPMAIDGITQYLGWRESVQLLRFITGLLVSGGILLASAVIDGMIEANYEKLLPEELVTLLKESVYYEEMPSLLEYRNMINEMKIQISGSENSRAAVKYCTKCGKPLEKTWMSCPYCGNE